MKLQIKILSGYLGITGIFILVGILIISNISQMSPIVEHLEQEVPSLDDALVLSDLTAEIRFYRMELEAITVDRIVGHEHDHLEKYNLASEKLDRIFDQAITAATLENKKIFENLFEVNQKLENTERKILNLMNEGELEQASLLFNDEQYDQLKHSSVVFLYRFSSTQQSQSKDVFSSLVEITNNIQKNTESFSNLSNLTVSSILAMAVAR